VSLVVVFWGGAIDEKGTLNLKPIFGSEKLKMGFFLRRESIIGCFCGKKEITLLGIFIILFLIISSAHALILPPDPFESTDRYALLISAPVGTINQVKAKVSAPGPESLGAGELRAVFQYKLQLPQENSSAVSRAVIIQGLSSSIPSLMEFDFSEEPLPAGSYHRTLTIYYQETPDSVPLLVAEYRPEQLLSDLPGSSVQTPPPPPGSSLVLGPISILREREIPITEQIPFNLTDSSGPFILRLTNGSLEGTHRASSAVVKLNGSEVFRPSELNQQVGGLSRQVTLLPGDNLLEVRLRSAPGSFLTLELLRLGGNACAVYDLHTFIRSNGQPVLETETFELPPQFSSPFVLNLSNGNPDGSDRADSASVTLNGSLAFDPNDFNEQIEGLSQSVPLLPTNTLAVELRGSPGDRISLWITGHDNIPPHVTVTSPSNGATFTASPISVSGTVDDFSANITVNGTTVPVGPDGSFHLDGIVLQEGENIIKVIGTDSCGNQGEDQIVVYLRTVPAGPLLILCAEPFREQVPEPPGEGEDCSPQAFGRYYGLVTGLTDETAVSVTLNGTLMPDGVEINGQGDIYWGMREGNFFWAFIIIPQVDGIHPFSSVATNSEGGQSEAGVTFLLNLA
jgi:hypothetical protein